ncbi:MAG: ABC transporter substrate-binding protein [Candidatus Bipolaricaulaceae bacterium]
MRAAKLIWLSALLVLTVGAMAVTGVAQPKAGGTFIMGLGEEPDTLDPDKTNRFHSLVVLNYVVEPLFALDADYEPVPLLIEGYEWSEDKLTMVVHLKQGITFHNGQEMTSRDVKSSYERYFEQSPLASYLPPDKGGIVEIETPDPYTVIFHFERPKPLALFYMADAHISIMPADWLAATPDENVGVKSLIGTGPFKFVEWIRGDRIVMERFEDYDHGPDFISNKGPAYIERLIMRIVPEDATMVAEIMAGNIDFTFDVPLSAYRQLSALDTVNVLSAPTFSVQYLVCNMEKDVFVDKRVRMAIAHAVNKEEIAKAAWFGVGKVLYGLVGPATTGYWKGMPHVAYPYDVEKAAAYLDAAGWVDTNGNGIRDKDGRELQLTLITFSNIDQWKRAGEIVQAQLAKVGIKVNLELAEVGATYDRAEASDYELGIFRNTWWMGVPYLTFLTHSDNVHSSNFGQLQNDALDTMLELSAEALDDDLRKEAFYVAQALLVESAVWIPLVANVNIVAAKPDVGGLDEVFSHPWQPPIMQALLLYKK